jgi:hypothetical protein
MEFQDAWEEEDGEPFYLWINEWLAGRWDEFVAPWKAFTMKVLRGRGVGPTLHEQGPSQYYVWRIYFDDGSNKLIKVTSKDFDPEAYYAKQNKVVVNVDYNWEPKG